MVVIGSVIDKETKEKIQKATVNINPQNIDTTFSTQTDSLGNFELKTLKANTKYTLFVYAKDYFVASKELWLAKPDSYYVKLQLSAPKVEIGCVATIRTIHFENNEFLFEPISFPDLMIMDRYLVQHPEFKLEIGGHTDSYGKASYNQWLSEKRAEVVADFFIGLGVPEQNITSKGYGEANLLFPDTSSENRYMNRRVEIKLVGIEMRNISYK
jgi:hypothetical protein